MKGRGAPLRQQPEGGPADGNTRPASTGAGRRKGESGEARPGSTAGRGGGRRCQPGEGEQARREKRKPAAPQAEAGSQRARAGRRPPWVEREPRDQPSQTGARARPGRVVAATTALRHTGRRSLRSTASRRRPGGNPATRTPCLATSTTDRGGRAGGGNTSGGGRNRTAPTARFIGSCERTTAPAPARGACPGPGRQAWGSPDGSRTAEAASGGGGGARQRAGRRQAQAEREGKREVAAGRRTRRGGWVGG